MNKFAKELVVELLIAASITGAVLFFVRPTVIRQTSMQNTINPRDYLFISRRAYVDKEPERGDIIVFQTEMLDEKGREKKYIKRVIGLPGEKIAIRDGKVFINGEALDEPYTKDGYTAGELEEYTVPDGEYFAMGDNRQGSVDSRSKDVGCVTKEDICGKAVIRIYPFNSITRFDKA